MSRVLVRTTWTRVARAWRAGKEAGLAGGYSGSTKKGNAGEIAGSAY